MTSRQRVRKLPTRNANRDAEAQAEIRNNQSAAGAPPTPDITHELRCHLCMCRHCVLVSPRRLVSMHDIIRDAPYHSVLYEITISLLKAWEQNINSLKGKSPYYCKFTSIFCCHMLPDSSCDVQPTATSTHKASYLITLVIMVFKQRHEPLYIIVTSFTGLHSVTFLPEYSKSAAAPPNRRDNLPCAPLLPRPALTAIQGLAVLRSSMSTPHRPNLMKTKMSPASNKKSTDA